MKFKSFLFGLFAILLLWMLLPLSFAYINTALNLPQIDLGVLKSLGNVLTVGGVLLALIASLTFKLHGRGTPMLTEPPKKLVIKGVYKFTRNPIYVAHALIYLGLFLSLGHIMLLGLFLIGVVGLHIYLIRVEEPILKARYGEDYVRYTQQVSRWFIL